jgi:hypothetical protein
MGGASTNASAQPTLFVRQFLMQKRNLIMEHPPRSSDLAAYDSFLFLTTITWMKRFTLDHWRRSRNIRHSTKSDPRMCVPEMFPNMTERTTLYLATKDSYFKGDNSN